jgi:Ca-activated chloride channel family protein
MRFWHRLLLSAMLGSAVAVAGPEAGRQGAPVARFSSQVQLVEVYATVTDAAGGVVTDLGREDFEVYEDGRRQEIAAFAAGEFPLTVALGVDRSWSMAGNRLRLAKQASRAFLRSLRPGDRTMVVAISSEAEVVAPLTMSRGEQEQQIARLDPWSTTALRDAVIATLDRLEGEPGRRALVVFSDGADRYSTVTTGEVIARARRSNALIYPIALGEDRPPILAELAAITGGRSFLLRDIKGLDETLGEVARELRYQYLLGYVPAGEASPPLPEWRSISVVARKPGLRVRARDGYLAGQSPAARN